jgi:hypothetical protein
MSAEMPTSTEGKKPDTLFIRCSVVVIYTFLAAIVLDIIIYFAFFLDRKWGLLGGAMDVFPVFSKHHDLEYFFPYFWGTLLQLAWCGFLVFCYICGRYDQVADKYRELEWIEMPWGRLLSDFGKFPIFPLSFLFFGFIFINLLLLLANCGVWMWSLIF